jgi:hypothetical protein
LSSFSNAIPKFPTIKGKIQASSFVRSSRFCTEDRPNRGGFSCFYYGRAVSLTLRSAIMESGEFSPRDRPL